MDGGIFFCVVIYGLTRKMKKNEKKVVLNRHLPELLHIYMCPRNLDRVLWQPKEQITGTIK